MSQIISPKIVKLTRVIASKVLQIISPKIAKLTRVIASKVLQVISSKIAKNAKVFIKITNSAPKFSSLI